MPVSFRAASGNTGEDVTSLAVTKPTGVVQDDYMVAALVCDSNVALSGMAAPAGWNLVYSVLVASGLAFKVFDKTAGASEGTSYTFTMPTADASAGIVAFSGQNVAAPYGDAQTSTNSTASTTHTAPTATGVADGMLLTVYGCGSTTGNIKSYTPPSGMTERVDTNTATSYWTGLSMCTQALTVAGATGTKAATCSQSTRTATVSVVVVPSVSGTGGGALFIPILLF